MKKNVFYLFILLISFILLENMPAQNSDTVITSKTLSGIEFRSIGPAFMSGRIADIAVHPKNNNTWYVAVGSGGVWKTVNSGTTWEPIFDKQTSYSIGCITIDPNNSNIIWVGTGENIGGRHVGYGDGVYRSEDGGKTWKNMGLTESEHISKIIVSPINSNVIYLAAQGPLWSKGGERGFYKSSDFGNTWKKTLGDDEWTGVTDIIVDPRNPNLVYAATWQRHRNVASYMGGGPGSGIFRSTDGGETWEKLKNGTPKSNLGKIGLAISYQNPDVVYAAIELDRRTGGIFRSSDRGASWIKMSDAVSGATGPHYYQELYTSPHQFDKLYLVDVRVQESDDGGKNFRQMSEQHKHSDNHAIAFKLDDPNYILVGTDGGLYESFDSTKTWRFINNLPVTQFYKVAVDDKEPFYNIYGGTQDNSTQGGPSRTDNVHGIRNADWFLTLGGDGHQPATEPGNPNIVYSESQEGYLSRVDMTTGEIVSIQPQPDEDENFERFNWDAPILISPHSSTRVYYASQRLWKSENRGDSWITISGDLTKNQDRFSLPIMENKWSWDSPWDVYAMSNYNTITSISESPVKEGLIYIGTDDGIIQVTEDGGKTWRKIGVSKLPGVPENAFINDIKADLFDENTLFVVLDNHKSGDFSPYIFKSNDKGNSWKSISSKIPKRTLLWRIVQDHEEKDLLFLATEFGIYFTINGGEEWIKLNGGIPTISFRDLAIQRRENDLVGASFGRGFFILDDYSFLRELRNEDLKNKEADLYVGRDAYLYVPRPGHGFSEKASQGSSYFTAENPPFGATFTYFLSKEYKTLKEEREEKEGILIKGKKPIDFPGWDKVEEERRQKGPSVWLTITDADGNVIKNISCQNKRGFHRITWDLRLPNVNAIDTEKDLPKSDIGMLVMPGQYYATLLKEIDGVITKLSVPRSFAVKNLYEGALRGPSQEMTESFRKEYLLLSKEITLSSIKLNKAQKKIEALYFASKKINLVSEKIGVYISDITRNLYTLDTKMNGSKSKNEVGEKNFPTIQDRYNSAGRGLFSSTYGPTETHIKSLKIVRNMFAEFEKDLDTILDVEIPKIEEELIKAGAPPIF